jgi:predicted DNA-binding transcriptional regulator AlpA
MAVKGVKKMKKKKMTVKKSLLRKKFLNVNEVAELLGVIKRSVWRFRVAKQIPRPCKIWKKSYGQMRTLWNTSDLRRWIAQGCPSMGTIQSKQKSAAVGKMVSNKFLRDKKFLKVVEMMKFLGVSKRTLWRFKAAKQIPEPHKIWDKSVGRMRVVWKAGDLRRWIKQGSPSNDTIKFAHRHPLHAAMLSYKHSRQRVMKMKSRVMKSK